MWKVARVQAANDDMSLGDKQKERKQVTILAPPHQSQKHSYLKGMDSNLIAMASNVIAMAPNSNGLQP